MNARRAVVFAVLCYVPLSLMAADEDDDEKPVAAGRQFNITEQNFEQLVFGAAINGNRIVVENGVQRVISESISAGGMARKRMESAIDGELRWIEAGCQLTDVQKKKLRLAGRGDIESFFSRAADLHTKVVGRSLDQQEYRELSQQLSLLRMASQNGLLNEASLFRKTLRRTLDEQQRTDYQKWLRQRQLDAAESGFTVWDQQANNNVRVNGVKLSPEARRKICERIVAQGRLPESASPYMNYIVLLEADRIAEDIRPLMDDTQWEAFQKLVLQAKRIEPSIRRYAQWPPAADSDDDETKD